MQLLESGLQRGWNPSLEPSEHPQALGTAGSLRLGWRGAGAWAGGGSGFQPGPPSFKRGLELCWCLWLLCHRPGAPLRAGSWGKGGFVTPPTKASEGQGWDRAWMPGALQPSCVTVTQREAGHCPPGPGMAGSWGVMSPGWGALGDMVPWNGREPWCHVPRVGDSDVLL